MMVLLLINLTIIIFDWFFLSETIRNLLKEYVNPFYHFYNDYIHKNFVTIDLIFVGIFLTELLIRWAIAIKRRTYYRWFFYPFVHWYDTLGCIPISTFRFFRILRVISIAYRMQRLAMVDLTRTYIYRVTSKYYNILIEEISDRVVINVLNGLQDEVTRGNPVVDQIVGQVIQPRKDLLIEWMAHKIRKATFNTYTMYQEEVRQYLEKMINEAIANNNEIKAIEQIPVFGQFISSTLEKAISDITYNTIDNTLKDLTADKNHHIIHGMTEHMFEGLMSNEEDYDLKAAAREAFTESLELIKQQVKVKQWKLKEQEMKDKIQSME